MKEMLLSKDAQERKQIPMASGLLDYFPLACAAVANASFKGNEQHNPGQPLHWDKTKSTDHADCILRHLVDRDAIDTDGVPHVVKLAWRGLALCQIWLENQQKGEYAPSYDAETLKEVEIRVAQILENCTLGSSPTGADHDRQVITPHLEAVLDEIHDMKGF